MCAAVIYTHCVLYRLLCVCMVSSLLLGVKVNNTKCSMRCVMSVTEV